MPDTVQDLVRAAAAKHGIPAELALAIAEQESSFNPTAIGPEITAGPAKGQRAIGTFQIVPSTAKLLGIDANDPRQNIDGGAKYLRQLMDKHKGNLDSVLREYGGVVDDTTYVPGVMTRIGKFKAAGGAGAAGVPGAPVQAGGVGGRGGGAGPLAQSQAPGAGPGPPQSAISTDLPTPPGMLRQLAEPFNPMTPEGRTNLAATAVSTGVGMATGGAGGPLSGTLTGRAIQILAPILGSGLGAAGAVAAENALGTGGDPRSAVGVGLENAAYEAGGQLLAWPLARLGRKIDAPGLARETIGNLRGQATRVTAEGNALVADVKAKVAEAMAAADAVKNAGVMRGPGAASNLAQQDLDGAAQLASIADTYNNLLAQSPDLLGAGRSAAAVLTGPAKQALDDVGQQVAEAAHRGPALPIAPIKDLVNDLMERWRPAELFGSADEAVAPQLAAVGARPQGVAVGQRMSVEEYHNALKQLANAPKDPEMLKRLPGILGQIQQVSGETIPFEVAHTLKQILDSSVNWDQRAKSIVARMTKATRGGLREQMAGFQPYDDATAAYRALIPLHVKGAGRKLIRLANDPDGAIKIADALKSGDAAQAMVIKNLLVDQASAAGELSQGMHAWNAVRAAYTHDHLLAGGIDGLTKRLDDLMTLRPQFVNAVFNDDTGQQVWKNLAQIGDAYKAGRAALDMSGQAAVTGAKATAEGAKQRVAADIQKFADSSLSKFTRQTIQSTEADIALAAGTQLHSIFGIQAALRLLQSPKAADVLEWAAYSNHNTHKLTRLLTSPVPAEFAATVIREMTGQLAPPVGQRGDRITPTGTAAR